MCVCVCVRACVRLYVCACVTWFVFSFSFDGGFTRIDFLFWASAHEARVGTDKCSCFEREMADLLFVF